MIKVLINAYACSPDMGSEPGMAWNWCVNLAKYCELEIITEGEFRDKIEAVLPTLSQGKNMHFHYNPVSDKIRQMCWNQGDWRFYWYYRKWQKKTYQMALDIINQKHIDVIHQLNMIGFREPGYLWKIKDIPFVWGPIGGMELMPTAYLEGTPLKVRLKVLLKNLINDYQRKHQPRVLAAIKRADALIAATKGAYDLIHDYHHKDVVLINETGCYYYPEINKVEESNFNILWAGKFSFPKRLDLALEALAATKNKHLILHILGTGTEEQVYQYKTLAKSLGIDGQCKWYGNIPHDKAMEMMRKSDLFFFTSIYESTSTVVPEAISSGLPVLSFNTCGFGPLVKEFAGVAVQLTTPKESVQEFAKQLNYLTSHKEILKNYSQAELNHSMSLSWENKAREVAGIYGRMTKK